jgi:hypothetical protein
MIGIKRLRVNGSVLSRFSALLELFAIFDITPAAGTKGEWH